MPNLSPNGQTVVNDVAARHGFSADAVTHVLIALDQGGGTQAQFNHFELGGMGQWSMGGMTMIGDMFNNGLKARVDGLCSDLSNVLAGTQVFQAPAPVSYQGQSQSSGTQMQSSGGMSNSSLFVAGGGYGTWWPQDLGQPGSTGAQNDMKYAYFPMISRLAILVHGQVTVYDTGAHQIGGFGQQQSGDQSLTFTSQFGLVRVADLPIVTGQAEEPTAPSEPAAPEPVPAAAEAPSKAPEHVEPEAPSQPTEPEPAAVAAETPPEAPAAVEPAASASAADQNVIFDSLEKLGQLHERGILTEDEFSQKKAELLARL